MNTLQLICRSLLYLLADAFLWLLAFALCRGLGLSPWQAGIWAVVATGAGLCIGWQLTRAMDNDGGY